MKTDHEQLFGHYKLNFTKLQHGKTPVGKTQSTPYKLYKKQRLGDTQSRSYKLYTKIRKRSKQILYKLATHKQRSGDTQSRPYTKHQEPHKATLRNSTQNRHYNRKKSTRPGETIQSDQRRKKNSLK